MEGDTENQRWMEQLRKAVGSGNRVDLAPGVADYESDPPYSEEGLSARRLPADAIRKLLLEPGLTVDPQGLRIRGALVTGILDFDHSTLPCRLVFTHCRFDNAPSFRQAAVPSLVLTHVALPGLSLDSAHVAGNVEMSRLRSTGEVRAFGVHIGGQLVLAEAKLTNPDGNALNLDGASITADAFLSNLEAAGQVWALGLHVGGQLVLAEAKLTNPNGNALNLDGADITAGAYLNNLDAVGQVRAPGAHIGGQLVLKEAKLTSSDGDALNLSWAILDHLVLSEIFTAEGGMDLSFTSIRVLSVGKARPDNGLPPLSGAQGWTLGSVHGFLRTDRKSARAWLDTIDTRPRVGGRREFASQPWKEMAKIYDQIGQPEDARWLRFWAARRTTRVAPWTSKLIRWPYAGLVGYGYYPAIVIGWLAVLWVTALVLCSLNTSAFTPTLPGASTVTITNSTTQPEKVSATGATPRPAGYPAFDARLFAVDTALPAAATGQSNAWRITENTWMQGIFAAIKGFSWLLTVLLLAGITGILRKD